MRVWQQHGASGRWGISFVAVVLVHATVVAAALWWQASRPPAVPGESSDAVLMDLAPLDSAPPAPPTDLAQGPQLQAQDAPQASKVAPAPTAPAATPAAVSHAASTPALPAVEAADAVLPQQSHAQIPSPPPAAVQASAPPSMQAPPGQQYASSQDSSGDAHTDALAQWQAQVLGRLSRFKRYPHGARAHGSQGMAWVRYAVDRQGQVLSAELARSSNSQALDGEAVAAVHRASPLPAPPAEITGDPVIVVTPVVFSLKG